MSGHDDNGPHDARDVASVFGPLAAGELGLITRDVVARTGAQVGLLAAWDPADRLLHVICESGVQRADGQRLPVDGELGFVGRVLESGRATVEPVDSGRDLNLGVSVAGVRYAAGAPVGPPGGPPGALCLGFRAAPLDWDLTLWVLEGYARLASLCLHDANVLEGLLTAARIDGLTGCMSYPAVRSELHREIARCARNGRPMSVCLIDVDRFKRVNERYGHAQGSRVIAGVAAVLRDGVRISDTLGRYGADEFLALLPDTDQTAACWLAERLRSTIFTTLRGATEPLGASIGVAQWKPGTTADELLAAAESALLGAQQAGGGAVLGELDIAGGPGDAPIASDPERSSLTRDAAAQSPAPPADAARGDHPLASREPLLPTILTNRVQALMGRPAVRRDESRARDLGRDPTRR
jgi:diguanylate cyclase (GGDEF)-like protein